MNNPEFIESEEQAVALNSGRGELFRAVVDIHPPHIPDYKIGAAEPHQIDFVPTDGRGKEVTVRNLVRRGLSGEPQIRNRTWLHGAQHGSDTDEREPFRFSFDKPIQIGDLVLGRMRSMAQILRTPHDDKSKLEIVDEFDLEELEQVSAIILETGDHTDLKLASLDDGEAAEIDVIKRGVTYNRLRMPIKALGTHVVKDAEQHKIRSALALAGVIGGATVAGIFIRHNGQHKK